MFDTLGVASIAPFMAVVLDETLVQRTPLLGHILDLLGAATRSEQLLAIGALTLVAILAANLAAGISLYLQQKFVARCRQRLPSELFANYMRRPYAFHLQRDAASLLSVIYHDADIVVNVINNALSMITRFLILIAVTILLIVKSPILAMASMALLGGSYGFVYKFTRSRQHSLGEAVSAAYDARGRAAQEGLAGVKELIVLGRTAEPIKRFEAAMALIAHGTADTALVSAMPRLVLESIAYCGLVIITLIMVTAGGGARSAIPVLAMFAFASYRLLPALQQLFTSAVIIRFSQASMDVLQRDWLAPDDPPHDEDRVQAKVGPSAALVPTRSIPPAITLHDVCMKYEGSAERALRHISLSIKPGESVGIVGRTGSGKTTLVDLILGLHEFDSGSILIDGHAVDRANMALLQRRIGYVPQHVFLANASIAENIAFGVPAQSIDEAAVARAAQLAQAEEFISRLPDGFDSVVGERGVRLSGGQRQRLGIARALYHQPSLLVFDEATSALDGMTEAALMSAIRQLAGEHTVILIAHRLKTVEACDRIIMLENGVVVGDGNWKELTANCPTFVDFVRGPAIEAVA